MAVAIGAGSNLGQLHVTKIPCQGALYLIDTGCPFWWLFSGSYWSLVSSKWGYRAPFLLPGSRMPWSLTKLFSQLCTDCWYLDWLPTVCPFVVIHSTTGTLLCPFSFLDYWVLNSFVGFIPICMFYFPLCRSCALSVPFDFYFDFVSCLFFGGILFPLFSWLGTNLFFYLPFSSWFGSGVTGATML